MVLDRRALALLLPLTTLIAGCGAGSSPIASDAGSYSRSNYGVGDDGGGSGPPPVAPSQPGSMDAAAGPGASPAARTESNVAVQQPSSRPGLGTSWGDTKTSHLSSAPFSRADSSNPFAIASLFYNNEEGAKAMASSTGFTRNSQGQVDIGNGIATMTLKDTDTGRFLTGFEANSKEYVVGRDGQRYSIVVTSHVSSRMEVVLSVDGDDVIDGKSASFGKRGYIIDPNGEIEIEGFRQSQDAVAQFMFGSVGESYANLKHGESKNVGVIGIALFNEVGTNPSMWTKGEVGQRLEANPFPGQFATPPPSR